MTNGKRALIIVGILAAALVAVAVVLNKRDAFVPYVIDVLPQKKTTTPGVVKEDVKEMEDITVVATGLDVPWEMAFLPEDGGILVTERSGQMRRIKDGKIFPIQGVRETSEGGLLGLALHPKFDENHLLFVYLTTQDGGGLSNRIDRYRLDGDAVVERTTVIQDIPASSNHDGGRIVFGPDGKLYATTGDAGDAVRAQDKNSLAGKILRLNDDGSTPGDNPFGTPVWSYGHRNPQGLAWDGGNRLWATEHGRSGVLSGFDEVNLIEKGKNYGWPTIQGDETREGMEKPEAHSGARETWAPSGMAYLNGSLYFAGLRGESLYQAKLSDERVTNIIAHFKDTYGRLRAVRVGPDGALYITTSNRDGRGHVQEGDDKLIRIAPRVFDK